MSDRPPINKENVERFQAWVESVPEQARRALEVNGPKIAEAFESMARALGKREAK